jgi:hypothetical protein
VIWYKGRVVVVVVEEEEEEEGQFKKMEQDLK